MAKIKRDGPVQHSLGGVGGTYTSPEPDRNGYIGVDPMYANAANETDYPLEESEPESDEADSKPAKKAAAKKEEPAPPAPPAPPAS